jgi:hypothetical protein
MPSPLPLALAAESVAVPRATPDLRIIDGDFDDVLNALSEFIETTADPYVTTLDDRPLATFKAFRFAVELVDCEAMPNKIKGWLRWGLYEIPWEARRVSHFDDQASPTDTLRQVAVFHVEGP